MILDAPTMFAIIIALVSSCTVMIISIRRIGKLEQQINLLKKQLQTRQKG